METILDVLTTVEVPSFHGRNQVIAGTKRLLLNFAYIPMLRPASLLTVLVRPFNNTMTVFRCICLMHFQMEKFNNCWYSQVCCQLSAFCCCMMVQRGKYQCKLNKKSGTGLIVHLKIFLNSLDLEQISNKNNLSKLTESVEK